MDREIKFTMEPLLEERSRDWADDECLRMASVFDDWGRQLRMKVLLKRAAAFGVPGVTAPKANGKKRRG